MRRFKFTIVALAMALLVPAHATEENPVPELRTDNMVFGIRVLGIEVGSMSMAARANDSSYGASAVMQPNTLVRILPKYRKVKYIATSRGWLRERGFEPVSYKESANTGNRISEVSITYEEGVPVEVAYDPPRAPREEFVEPLDQGGTIDPMTAFYIVMRDAQADEICDREFSMFDGRRRSKVLLGAPTWNGEEAHCEATYVRVAGFTEDEMNKRTDFPITLLYKPRAGDPGWYQLAVLETETRFGKLKAIRR